MGPMRATLKFKLIALSLAFNTLVLAVFAVFALNWYHEETYRGLDQVLELEAQRFVDSVSSYLSSTFRGNPKASSFTIQNVIHAPGFSRTLDLVVEAGRYFPKVYRTTSGVFDRTGALVYNSDPMTPLSLPSRSSLTGSGNGAPHSEITISTQTSRDFSYRVYSYPIIFQKNAVALVQTSCLTDPAESTFRSFQILILIGTPTILLLISLPMVLLVNRAFRPISDIISTILRITGKNLKVRVPLPSVQDEIYRLGETFNGMLDRIDEAFDFQTRLVQDLSHQLRTPLSVLKGTLETGLRRMRTANEYEEILESNLEEVNRITRLIESMLLLAQLDSKSVPLGFVPVDVSALIGGLAEDLDPLMEQKKITIQFSIPPGTMVLGDELRLRQVFLNLLDNSYKFSPVGGIITVRGKGDADGSKEGVSRDGQSKDNPAKDGVAGRGDNQVAVVGEPRQVFYDIIVENQGPPIASQDLPLVFDRFYRAAPAEGEVRPKSAGFGLGLSIARGIVELHGGRIYASNPESGGAAFIVRLPAA